MSNSGQFLRRLSPCNRAGSSSMCRLISSDSGMATSSQRNCNGSCGGLAVTAARSMVRGPSRRGGQCKPSRTGSMRHCRSSDRITSCWRCYRSHPDKTCSKPCPWGENPAPDGRCMPGAMTGLPIKTAALSHPKPQSLVTGWRAAETTALEDAIPKIPAREPVMTAPAKPQPIPRMMIAAPPTPKPTLAAARGGRDQP